MALFSGNDIRGIYGKTWDEDTAYRLGFYLPAVLDKSKILVGRDIRLSSEEIFGALSSGIRDPGANIIDIGLCSTPELYFANAYYGFRGSVMITAPGPGRGRMESLDFQTDYLEYLKPIKRGIGKLKLVTDCSDGMAGTRIWKIMADLPVELIALNDQPDGHFPHHGPNPMSLKSWTELSRKVQQVRAVCRGAYRTLLFQGLFLLRFLSYCPVSGAIDIVLGSFAPAGT